MMSEEVKTKSVLGIKIDDVSINEAIDVIFSWLKSNKKHYIVTPNPEFIMTAQNDPKFKEILNKADLAIPDGSGLKISGKITNTTTGTDLIEEIFKKGDKAITIGFLGGSGGVAKKAAERLRKKYPGTKILYAEDGPKVNFEGEEVSPALSNKYHKLRVDIVCVGFGQIKQEKWISKNLDKLPVKIAIGVGGAFDYFSGKVKRAPLWIRNLGLEWLFRLAVQPWRIKRQSQLVKYYFKVKRS